MAVRFLKLNRWWGSHFGTMLAFSYLATAFSPIAPSFFIFTRTLIIFVVATIGIATFGHLLNDLTDIEQDVRSNMPNTVANLGIVQRILLFGLILGLGILPWRGLPISELIIGLLIIEYSLFVIYSVPPIRLKARGIWGVVTDSLYAYVITNAIAILVFTKLSGSSMPWLVVVAASWMFIFGLGHIIQHQLIDAERDYADEINTFVISKGWNKSLRLLKKVILPLDYLLCWAFLIAVASRAPIIPLVFILNLFIAVTRWQCQTCSSLHDMIKLDSINTIHLHSNQIIAGFTWNWLPALSLLTLISYHPTYLPIAPFHFFLFPQPIRILFRQGLPAIQRAIKQV
jgi:4-hydroxybenzoate polyprenyltransferase